MSEVPVGIKVERELKRSIRFWKVVGVPITIAEWLVMNYVRITYLVSMALILWVYWVDYVMVGNWADFFVLVSVLMVVAFGVVVIITLIFTDDKDRWWGVFLVLLPWYFIYKSFTITWDVPKIFATPVWGDENFTIMSFGLFLYTLFFMQFAMGRGGEYSPGWAYYNFVNRHVNKKKAKLEKKYGVQMKIYRVSGTR